MPKILSLINSCEECPHHRYGSGGTYECREIGEIVRDKSIVAPFCPLVDYPGRVIANMDTTIRALREPNKYGLVFALLSHLATKLNVLLDAHGMNIPTKNNGDIYLFHEAITRISTHPSAIHFVFGDRKFKILPDVDSPKLYEDVKIEGVEGESWRGVALT